MVRHFTTNEVSPENSVFLRLYEFILNAGSVSVGDLAKISGIPGDLLEEKLRLLEKRKAVELSRDPVSGALLSSIAREHDGKGFLGISFDGEYCFLTVLDARGEVSRKENLRVESLKTLRGRVGELKDILKTVSETTSFKGIPLRMGGVVIQDLMAGKDKKGIAILTEGLSRIFKCDVFAARRAAAAAYADKHLNPSSMKSGRMLYLHTDSGEGVFVEGESIVESRGPGDGKESYLRAWDQFDAAKTARDLAKKGLGTDMVGMVKGNLDLITISEVMEASEKGDELAEDLVKRSASALGVRAAYLTNLFNAEMIVLGGGIENPRGKFKEFMKESFDRFVLSENAGKAEIAGGISVEGLYSLGAALLCRREIFMEV